MSSTLVGSVGALGRGKSAARMLRDDDLGAAFVETSDDVTTTSSRYGMPS